MKKNTTLSLKIAAIASSLYGLLLIASAVHSTGSVTNVIVQSVAIVLGVALMLFFASVDYQVFLSLHKIVFIVYMALLILVLLIGTGRSETGTEGWISLGPVNIQPAEFAKLGFIITFAYHINAVQDRLNKPTVFLGLLLHLAAPLALILLQPDYGTGMVFIFIALVMLFFGGLKIRYFLIGGGIFAVSTPILWSFLQDFQKNRIINFIRPETDPVGSGYNVLQSIMTVGSGKFFGKGLFNGSQIQLGFLPGKHTDFIFAVAGEELGFLGCLVILFLLGFLIFKILSGQAQVRNQSGQLICAGVAAMLIFQVFENVGMNIGIMPVTGIPLPFFSYGGSSVITSFAAIGMVLSVLKRKDVM